MTAPTFAQPGATTDDNAPDAIAGDLAAVIRQAADHAPRSLQRTLGPSEAGMPCDLRLAYRMLDWDPKPNQSGGDPIASIIGTATHDWLAAAFSRPELGGRFLVEQRVTIAPPYIPGGSCDLYDTHTQRVIDWKVVGQSSVKKYRSEGPRHQYVIQAHLYGLGWELAGHTPREVALAFIPRAGLLSGMWVWSAPYDRAVAIQAIQRVVAMFNLICAIDPEATPSNWQLIPKKPGHECVWCPWFQPGSKDLSTGCPGDLPPTR